MQGHILEEWRIRDVEQKAERANSRFYELDALKRDVAGLEHSLREARSDIDGLRYELQACKDQHAQDLAAITERLDEIERHQKGEGNV